jgi:diguanylate cyclase (GGDEF)-like protein/PAS domain S-box-containing protein
MPMKFSPRRLAWTVAWVYAAASAGWFFLGRTLFIHANSPWPEHLWHLGWMAGTAALFYWGVRYGEKMRDQAYRAQLISQERFQQLAENTLGFLYRYRLIAPAGFEYVSPTVTTILGHTPEALYANPVLGGPLLQAEEPPDLASLAARGRSLELPTVIHCARPDGTVAWLEQRYVLVHDEVGRLIAIQGVVRDVTERKRAEKALFAQMHFVSTVLDMDESLVVVLDPQGRLTGFNRACERLTGFAFDEMRGSVLWDLFLSPEEAQAAKAEFLNLRPEQPSAKRRSRWLTRRGGRRLVDWSYTALPGDQGSVESVIGIGTDVTERQAADDSLQQTAQSLKVWVDMKERHDREISLLNEMGELLQACKATQEAYDVIGRRAAKLFPAGALYVIGENGQSLEPAARWGQGMPAKRPFAPTDCWALRRAQAHLVTDTATGLLCSHLDAPPPASYLCVPLITQSEPLGLLYLQCQPGEAADPETTPAARLLAAQQIALTAAEQMALALSNLKLRETLRSQAIRDPLTGLFNRRYLEESFDRELHRAARNQTPLSVILMDLDHFKRFNDTFGHEAGDLLLCEVGGLLKSSVRGGDILCRYGGEEFLLVMPEATLDAAQQRADLLRDKIKQLALVYQGQPLGRVTMSLGVAAYPLHGHAATDIVRAADRALYRAKADGRDRVVVAETTG